MLAEIGRLTYFLNKLSDKLSGAFFISLGSLKSIIAYGFMFSNLTISSLFKVLNLAHLNNKFFFILGPIATSLKFDTELIDNNLCFLV